MEVGEIEFCAATDNEHVAAYRRTASFESIPYRCAGCGSTTHGRVIAKAIYAGQAYDRGTIYWCLCVCGQPTIGRYSDTNKTFHQHPRAIEFVPGDKWPADVTRLYAEAALCFSASAFTAAAMLCRKILMVCAVDKGDGPDRKFIQYVDFITTKILVLPQAKTSIDKIRNIGNDANHDVAFVEKKDARMAMEIINYMLTTIYSLPG